MKTNIKNISKTKKKITLDVPVERVNTAFDKAADTIRKKAVIKGFRKGKIPDAILEKNYGHEIGMESLEILLQDTYTETMKEHGLTPLLKPEFDLKPLEKGKSYTYHVEVEVKPDFKLSSYTEIPVKKKETTITDKDVEADLDRIRDARGELTPAEVGDTLENGMAGSLDFEGTIDGKPFKGGSSKGYLLEYGKGILLKDFEEPIQGLKKGETKTIELTFPADYHDAELRGKKAEFKITLNELHRKKLPIADDEFAKDLGKENIAQVRNEIREMLTKREQATFKNDYAKEIIDYLVKKNKFDIPEGLLKLEMTDPNKKKDEVEESIRLQFVLEEIATKESIRLEPKELEEHFHRLSHQYHQPVDAIKKHFVENKMVDKLIGRLSVEKTLDFLIAKAKLG